MKPYLEIIRLVWPLALGMINNAVMQFVDRAYLAKYSMGALEAVLPAGMLMWIFAGFFQSLVGYASVFVGQFYGEGSHGKCRVAYRASLALALAAGALSVPLVLAGNWILGATTPDARLLADKREYFQVLMAGAVFVYGQMAAAAYFTGRGRTRIIFWVNLAGNLLNVLLDPLLIFGCSFAGFAIPGMGIAGAAYATLASLAVQMAVLMAYAARDGVAAAAEPGAFRSILWRIVRFGVPSGCYTVMNLLSFTIFVFVTESVGSLELAVSNACFTVNYLLFAPLEGFSLGASTLVAQAIGRGHPDEAIRATRQTMVLGLGFIGVLLAVTLMFSTPILDIFAPGDAAVAVRFKALGRQLLVLMAAWLFFDAADVIIGGALKGAGDTKFVMYWALFCAFAVWMPLVFAVRHFHNTMPALWATMIVYVVVICIGSVVRWRGGKWRRIGLLK